jgi:hypothetical protein
VGLLVVVAALIAVHPGAGHGRPGARQRPVVGPCPAVDDGCSPIPITGGVLLTATGRYQVGEPGDVVVVGRWWCGAVATPALLQPATGAVWVFATWPGPARPEPGRLAARIPAATSLRVQAQPSGCDRLDVWRLAAPALVVKAPRR